MNRVIAVACRFDTSFGCESKIHAKRQKSTTKKTIDPSFCPENYHIHLKSEHSICWKEYQALSIESKWIYFDIEVPFVNTIMSHLERDINHVTYIIDNDMVEVIIREMLWNLEDFEGQTYEIAMPVFTLDTHTSNSYVTIKTSMTYQLAIKYIDSGISLKQATLALQVTKEVVMIFKLGGMNVLKIATYVRVRCGANFQIISNILCMVWTFSLLLMPQLASLHT